MTPDQLIDALRAPADLAGLDDATWGSSMLDQVDSSLAVLQVIQAARLDHQVQQAVLRAINDLTADKQHVRHPRDLQVACLLVVVDRAVPEARSWACSQVWQNRSFEWADRVAHRIAERWLVRDA